MVSSTVTMKHYSAWYDVYAAWKQKSVYYYYLYKHFEALMVNRLVHLAVDNINSKV